MPAGPDLMGFGYFLAAKMVGYTAFSHWVVAPRVAAASGAQVQGFWKPTSILATAPPDFATGSDRTPILPSSLKAGVIRTLIGLTVGAAVGFGFWAIPYFSKRDIVGSIFFFAFLVPVRVGEWALLYRWIYRIHPFKDPGGMKLITYGLLVSFLLDAIGVVAVWVLPGGMWVC